MSVLCAKIYALSLHYTTYYNLYTSRVPVEGKSSLCLICMKYMIIILIIIIISLDEILLLYTYCKHITHAHTLTHTYVSVQVRCVGGAQA